MRAAGLVCRTGVYYEGSSFAYFLFTLFKTVSLYIFARLFPCWGMLSRFFLSFLSRRSGLVSCGSPFISSAWEYLMRGSPSKDWAACCFSAADGDSDDEFSRVSSRCRRSQIIRSRSKAAFSNSRFLAAAFI